MKKTVTVNKKLKRITAVIPEAKTPFQELFKYHAKSDVIDLLLKEYPGDFLLDDDKIIAHADCREGDEFNEQTGKLLAKARVDEKYHRMMYHHYKDWVSDLRNAYEIVSELMYKHARCKSHAQNMINRVLKSLED